MLYSLILTNGGDFFITHNTLQDGFYLTLTLLRQLGLDFVQGYLLGRPDFALQKLNPTIVQLLQEGIVKS